MTHRALRIRHYIGTIVAACLVGGLLLAHEARLRKQKIFGEKWVAETPAPLAARKL